MTPHIWSKPEPKQGLVCCKNCGLLMPFNPKHSIDEMLIKYGMKIDCGHYVTKTVHEDWVPTELRIKWVWPDQV